MSLLPEPPRLDERIDSVHLPPCLFGAVIVKRTVMKEAEGDRPFVADHAAKLSPPRQPKDVDRARRLSSHALGYDFGEASCLPVCSSIHFFASASVSKLPKAVGGSLTRAVTSTA
jgi:hypothetical protein